MFIWEVNKIMGLRYMGDEKDVVRRIAIIEAGDEERAKGQASQHVDWLLVVSLGVVWGVFFLGSSDVSFYGVIFGI